MQNMLNAPSRQETGRGPGKDQNSSGRGRWRCQLHCSRNSSQSLKTRSAQNAKQLHTWAVLAQLPKHHAAQMMVSDVCHFLAQRLWAVVAPECRIKQNGASYGFGRILPVSLRRQVFQFAIAPTGFSSREGRLIKSVIAVFHALPSLAVERHSKDEFFCRHA